MKLAQNLQKLAARLNTLPTKFGIESYQPLLLKYTNSLGIPLTVPVLPNPGIEPVKPQQVGKYLSSSVEVFQGDIVVSEVTRYQALLDPLSTQDILSKGKYLYRGKVWFCTHVDASDTIFLTLFLREDRLNR